MTLTDIFGNVIFKFSGGLLNLHGPKRSTNVTSEIVAAATNKSIIQKKIKFLILKINGVSHTRKMKSAIRSILSTSYVIIKCINITPRSHNGIRKKKRRRL
jgi:small subunit ribosomal protein S11